VSAFRAFSAASVVVAQPALFAGSGDATRSASSSNDRAGRIANLLDWILGRALTAPW
jgi:hypothetical protein